MIAKQIKFKDEIKLMTIEEVVIQFQALVNKLLKSWIGKYDLEDLKQIGNLGLVKAYNTYDYENNNTTFLTYAQTVIGREFLVNNRNNKNKDIFISSLNDTIKSKNEEDIELINLLKDENTNVEESAINNLQYEKVKELINNFNNMDKLILNLYFLENKKQTEIAQIIGVTQANVSRSIKKILSELKRDLSRERIS